jgi:hypothetical protein
MLFRLLAILIRVYAFYSPVMKKLADMLIFNNLNNLRESVLEYNYIKKLGVGFDSQYAVFYFYLVYFF